jgi:hypothetical protein
MAHRFKSLKRFAITFVIEKQGVMECRRIRYPQQQQSVVACGIWTLLAPPVPLSI